MENEGGYRWFEPFGSPKKRFLLIMHFAKPRVYRANRHPGHRNRRGTSIIIVVSNSSGTETDETISYTDTASKGKVDSDVIDSKTDTASEGEVWDSYRIFSHSTVKINLETLKQNEEKLELKNIKKNKRKERNKERKQRKKNEH